MIGVEVYENPKPCNAHEDGVQTGPCYCNSEWRFRIRAVNGEIVAASEGYTTKAAAEKGVRALRRALLPGTRDAEAMAKAWDEGLDAAGPGLTRAPGEAPPPNPYRKEIPRTDPHDGQQEPPC